MQPPTAYHYPPGFNTQQCRNDLDAPGAAIQLRTVQHTFKREESYVLPHYMLFIMLQGQKTFQDGSNFHTVDPGQALLIRQHAPLGCAVTRLDQGNCAAIMFGMETEFIASVLQKYALPLPQGPYPQSNLYALQISPFLQSSIESLLPYFIHRSPHHQALIQLKMEELLLHLLETDQLPQVLGVIGAAGLSRRQTYLALIEQCIAQPLSLAAMAEALHLSQSSFKREFQQLFGDSPGHYLLQQRLQRAYYQLQSSSKNVSEIAFDLGFESVSHFIQAFKKQFQTTPGDLKRTKTDIS